MQAVLLAETPQQTDPGHSHTTSAPPSEPPAAAHLWSMFLCSLSEPVREQYWKLAPRKSIRMRNPRVSMP
jgi:hypothetical protein